MPGQMNRTRPPSPPHETYIPPPPTSTWQLRLGRPAPPVTSHVKYTQTICVDHIEECRKRKDRPDRGSNLGLLLFMQSALPLSYPAACWRNHQLQQGGPNSKRRVKQAIE